MICLFCQRDSGESRSVEHIIPESLGNTRHILPRGVVCDRCNNYFAREVEKPFLDLPAIRALRFHQGLESKRGRIPPVDGMLDSGHPVTLYRYRDGPLAGLLGLTPSGADHLMRARRSTLVIPAVAPLPSGPILSRFLAKVAVEVLAERVMEHPDGLEYFAREPQLDLIRHHARRGDTPRWPVVVRSIYDENQRWIDPMGKSTQIVHEFNIHATDAGEYYFVFALFGLEMTINLGGPETSGYENWIRTHKGASPLYWGRNAQVSGTPTQPGTPPDVN